MARIRSFTIQKLCLLLTVFMLSFLLHSSKAEAAELNRPCTNIESILARGSGDGEPSDNVTTRFSDQLKQRVASGLTYSNYMLGTDSYGGYKYPHINVDFWNGNLAGASISSGYANDYGDSVLKGAYELQNYITQRYNKCKSYGTHYVLGGYSQGAQVIGEGLFLLSQEIRDRITFVGLFGDPKLHLPEGGIINPPACQGKNLSLYRRVVADCHLVNGRLGSRQVPAYLPADMHRKTGLWCISDDYVCGTTQNFLLKGHEKYIEKGAVDSAAQEAATRLRHAVANEQLNYEFIDISYKSGQAISGQDIIFAIDTEKTMDEPYRSRILNFIHATTDKLPENSRAAVAFYMGAPSGTIDNPGPVEQVASQTPFMSKSEFANYINTYFDTLYQPYFPNIGSPLVALKTTFDWQEWRSGAAKSVMILTNKKGFDSPDSKGNTIRSIAKRALEIDPVNVYVVAPTGSSSEYYTLAEETSGEVITYDNDTIETAANTALTKIQQRPIALLKNTEYIANPGQEITFDASDSYTLDGTITTYDWDFDGDMIFDRTTTTPSIDYTYAHQGNGIMQVRITTSTGAVGNASATLKIGTYVPPTLPEAPTNLTATVIDSGDKGDTVRLTWQLPDNPPLALTVSVNGIMLGLLTPDRTSIDITDIDRSDDVDFGIAGLGSDPSGVIVGDAAISTLLKPQPPTPASPTPTTRVETEVMIPTAHTATISSTTPTLAAIDTASVLGAQTTDYPAIHTPDDNHLASTATVPINRQNSLNLNLPWFWPIALALIAASILAWAIHRSVRKRY